MTGSPCDSSVPHTSAVTWQTRPATSSAASWTPTPSTAAASWTWSSSASAASASGACCPRSELRLDNGRLIAPFTRMPDRGLARPGRGPPRLRQPVARQDLLVLRGAGAVAYRDCRGAMAPQIWLLRHGEAVPHDSKPDDERELTARGERQSIAAGAGARPPRRRVLAPVTRARRCGRGRRRSSPARALNIEPVEAESHRRRVHPRRRARAALRPPGRGRRRARPVRRPRARLLAGRLRPHRRPGGLQEGRRSRP